MTGRSAGSVMCHIRRQRLGAVDGRRLVQLGSTVASAARKMMIPQPASFQTDCMVTSTRNVSGLVMRSNPVPSPCVAQRLVDQAGAAEHLLEDRHHQHPREEVRQVDDRLDRGARSAA